MSLRASALVAIVVAGCARKAQPETADTVLFNGHIIGRDASALAVRAGRIVAVGDDASVKALAGPATRAVDLAGRYAVASITDAHGHIFWYARALTEIDLRGCSSARDCAERVGVMCAREPTGWILGHGWDDTTFADKIAPSAEALEAVCPGREVFLRRIDGHAAWVSLAAMRSAGITDIPSAILVDASMGRIEVPRPTRAQIRTGILEVQSRLAAMGLTSVHEMGLDPEAEALFRELAASGELQLRVVAYAEHGGLKEPLDEAALLAHLKQKPDAPSPDRLFTMQGAKLWSDGALGSRGAALIADYSDAPGHRGAEALSVPQMTRIAQAAIAGGWQLAVHAIGDQANKTVLDAFTAAGVNGHRFRVEHAQVIAVADIARFAQLGVIASMQPTHATSDMRWAGARLGDDRLRGAYAWRSLVAAGAPLAFGSDFPVESPNPWEGLYAAVTRTNAAGEPVGGWRPQEALTRAEALRAFTEGAAYAAFQEKFRGTASPGQVADLTVIDRDILADTTDLRTVRVDMTMVGGRVVYER